MENKDNKQRNPLGLAGFIISVILTAMLPIIMFIVGDASRNRDSGLAFDIMMIIYFVPFVVSLLAAKRKPKGFAIAGTIISLAVIVLMAILRFIV